MPSRFPALTAFSYQARAAARSFAAPKPLMLIRPSWAMLAPFPAAAAFTNHWFAAL
jgi:hypothetical protein